jgi:hypothetical protein
VKQHERGPKVPDNRVKREWNAVEKEIIMAAIAYLKQQEINSGAREKWEKDQVTWSHDRAAGLWLRVFYPRS